MPETSFPPQFVWGAATSAYQIEGAAREDGRGESIWDRFAATPGKIVDGTSGEVACDHYHRWREDVALMAELGLGAYRFSIAWPRILPDGVGRVNASGLDHYSRLVDGLLARGLTPFATLFHWDLPQALEDRGGWAARATAEAFAEYADVVSRRLGDRVRHWITHNEPWCSSVLGYETGRHAPGRCDPRLALAASHHLLLSHGLAVPVLRGNGPGSQVGITLNLCPGLPASPSDADHRAWRRFDGRFNRWFLDPIHGRGYPADVAAEQTTAGNLPREGLIRDGDLDVIACATDFLGVNYYNRAVIRAEVPEAENLPRSVLVAPQSEWTEMGWEVYPDGLFQILARVHLEYGPRALYVTENGASYSDGPGADGRIRDTRRIAFLRGHLHAARRAIDAGVPLAGYFVWSLLDNYEWERGYTQRFGVVWVDYPTQRRTLKDSALWYRRVVGANAIDEGI